MSKRSKKAKRTGECAGCKRVVFLQNMPLRLCMSCNRARIKGNDPDVKALEAAAAKRERKARKADASDYAKGNATDEADDEREQIYCKEWPKGKPMPSHYRPARKYPCPSCRRVLNDYSSQACIVLGVKEEVAYLRCRVCGESHTLPVRED